MIDIYSMSLRYYFLCLFLWYKKAAYIGKFIAVAFHVSVLHYVGVLFLFPFYKPCRFIIAI